jgi:hypothetical protein
MMVNIIQHLFVYIFNTTYFKKIPCKFQYFKNFKIKAILFLTKSTTRNPNLKSVFNLNQYFKKINLQNLFFYGKYQITSHQFYQYFVYYDQTTLYFSNYLFPLFIINTSINSFNQTEIIYLRLSYNLY